MNNLLKLDEVQMKKIKDLASKLRLELGFTNETPIANNIFTVLEKLNISLLEYPIEPVGEKPAFSAVLIYSKLEEGEDIAFIGLNTADYYDKQIFAIAHELYHFKTKTRSHLSRPSEDQKDTVEIKANRFAAEFLLPEDKLKGLIINEFKTYNLTRIQNKALLRFIARLQCDWWLPYRSIVKRLLEIDSISEKQYQSLYSIDERHDDSSYGRIAKATKEEVFEKLNTITRNIGTSPSNIEIIIRNFEENRITEEEFNNLLRMFNKQPEDFNYKVEVDEKDIAELNSFFNEDNNNEN
ncbi:ImmA/IrrE family metallo-endopeptidase [Natranaerobius trueperi]|uniref:IrrE N-terminal-like domain-containing protein n=1 Tax=Natranaerobius trueperi TaxID=759412 RepID=A0A226BWG5_9FIRM|nr:ImmA/IrrE family metallo-endopeptidase [Natranaerobius trueperi]OWZ83251.1 hypothetical protein CDO51_09745 [Natranaerobius trueperi]